MHRIRRMRNKRGALEGLPLYLIILIVVAAIVVAILVGWLSTLQHPAIGTVSTALDTSSSGGSPDVAISDAGYPSCTAASYTGCFTPNTDGSCNYNVNSQSGGAALTVTVDSKSGGGLSGATVTLSGVTISVTAVPSLTQTTSGSGTVTFTSVSGVVPANDEGGGQISISITYSSGGVQSTGSASINVEPPSQNANTGAPVSC